MTVSLPRRAHSAHEVLLGDEAVALGAIHAGCTAAYAYPGTPSTEILEYVLGYAAPHGRPIASWCANEKTAMESALGVSMMGRRALVAMKHVGLNVAADPFVNAALVPLEGGLVVAVADDPGMHSSQNEQDSRWYAEFAHVPCLEPATQQEAYAMARDAFDLSERFHVPVLLRLVTRLAHSRAVVRTEPPIDEKPARRTIDTSGWILLPQNARRRWRGLLDRQAAMGWYAEGCVYNRFEPRAPSSDLGVITTGIARNYFLENAGELNPAPPHLHIGAYPVPENKVRALCERVRRVLVLEEGFPILETRLRGLLPTAVEILGKLSGAVPLDGELGPDVVRRALHLPDRAHVASASECVAPRPPQLCKGCPHADAFLAIREALRGMERPPVTSDIGCYTLGALPPYRAIDSCVCMGASVGMARGVADASGEPALAVIGDSTFLHSGVTPLMDAVAAGANLTLLILDNGTVAMTGTQPTVLPSRRLPELALAVGVEPEHVHTMESHPRKVGALAALLRREMEHPGPSVIVARRECLELIKARKRTTARAR